MAPSNGVDAHRVSVGDAVHKNEVNVGDGSLRIRCSLDSDDDDDHDPIAEMLRMRMRERSQHRMDGMDWLETLVLLIAVGMKTVFFVLTAWTPTMECLIMRALSDAVSHGLLRRNCRKWRNPSL